MAKPIVEITATYTDSITYDSLDISPTRSITNNGYANSNRVTVTFTWNIDNIDITYDNIGSILTDKTNSCWEGDVVEISSVPTIWEGTLVTHSTDVYSEYYTVTVSVSKDSVTNSDKSNEKTTFSWQFNTSIYPTITISSTEVNKDDYTNASSITLVFTSSLDIQTKSDEDDINIESDTGEISNLTKITDTIYTATYTATTTGLQTVSISQDAYVDTNDNNNIEAIDFTWYYYTETPSMDISITSDITDGVYNVEPITVEFTYSGDYTLYSFDVDSITTSNCNLSNFTTSTTNNIYTVDVTPIKIGSCSVSIEANNFYITNTSDENIYNMETSEIFIYNNDTLSILDISLNIYDTDSTLIATNTTNGATSSNYTDSITLKVGVDTSIISSDDITNNIVIANNGIDNNNVSIEYVSDTDYGYEYTLTYEIDTLYTLTLPPTTLFVLSLDSENLGALTWKSGTALGYQGYDYSNFSSTSDITFYYELDRTVDYYTDSDLLYFMNNTLYSNSITISTSETQSIGSEDDFQTLINNTSNDEGGVSSSGNSYNVSKNTTVLITDSFTLTNTKYINLIGDNIIIDGQNYTITIEGDASDDDNSIYKGFIVNGNVYTDGPCNNVIIRNLKIVISNCKLYYSGNASVSTTVSGSTVTLTDGGGGGICGAYFAREVSNGDIYIKNCSVTLDSSSTIEDWSGGILGGYLGFGMNNSNIVIENCRYYGELNSEYTGGICGYSAGVYMDSSSNITINQCWSSNGDITNNGGGIVAPYANNNRGINQTNASQFNINYSYNQSDIITNNSSGISGIYSYVTSNYCYSIGVVSKNSYPIALSDTSGNYVNNCYYTDNGTSSWSDTEAIDSGLDSGGFDWDKSTTPWIIYDLTYDIAVTMSEMESILTTANSSGYIDDIVSDYESSYTYVVVDEPFDSIITIAENSLSSSYYNQETSVAFIYNDDTDRPTITITSDDFNRGDYYTNDTTTLTFTSSSSITLETSYITVSRGEITNLTTDDNLTYTATYTASSEGLQTVSISKNVDSYNIAAIEFTWYYFKTIKMSVNAYKDSSHTEKLSDYGSYKGDIYVVLTSNAPTISFNKSMIDLTNAVIIKNTFTVISLKEYHINIRPMSNRLCTISVATNSYSDIDGTLNDQSYLTIESDSNDTLSVSILYITYSMNINSGTYSITDLVEQINLALIAKGLVCLVTYSSLSNKITFNVGSESIIEFNDATNSILDVIGFTTSQSGTDVEGDDEVYNVIYCWICYIVTPTMTITAKEISDGESYNSTLEFTFTSSIATDNFTLEDLEQYPDTGIFYTVDNTAFKVSSTVYKVNFDPVQNNSTITGPTLYYIKVPTACYTDESDNENKSAIFYWFFDRVKPLMTITSPDVSDNSRYNKSVVLQFNSSKSTDNFTVQDIQVSNGTIMDFTGSDTTYSALFIPNIDGYCTVQIYEGEYTDAATNKNVYSSFLWYNDITPPLVPNVYFGTGSIKTNPNNVLTISFAQDVNNWEITTNNGLVYNSYTGNKTAKILLNDGLYLPGYILIKNYDVLGNMSSITNTGTVTIKTSLIGYSEQNKISLSSKIQKSNYIKQFSK